MRETLGESQQLNDSLEVSFIELAVAGDVTGNLDIRACIERGQQVEFLEYKPILRFRIRVRSASESCEISSPSITMRPPSGRVSPPNR